MSGESQKLDIKPNGMVMYPREYSVDYNNPSMSYVRGVTQQGREVAIYLRIDEQVAEAAKNKDSATLPSIDEFAETKPTATRRCVASEDNSADKPQGVLLAEQVKPLKGDEAKNFGDGVFVGEAKWMSILQMMDYCPATIGPGFVDVSFSFKVDNETKVKIGNYHKLYRQYLNGGENVDKLALDEELDSLQREIINERKAMFSVVTLRPEEMVFSSLGSDLGDNANDRVQAFSDMIKEPLERATRNGQYGGAIIRVRRGDKVSSNLYDTLNMRYDGKKGEVMDFEDLFQNFLKFGNQNLIKAIRTPSKRRDDMVLEILPCVRTNVGPRSYDRYKKDILKLADSKILKTYVDNDMHRMVGIEDLSKKGGYVYSLMAVRNAEAGRQHNNNLLVSAFHSYSAPITNALLINPENHRYGFSGASSAPTPANHQPSTVSP